jgi:hypothetical protein
MAGWDAAARIKNRAYDWRYVSRSHPSGETGNLWRACAIGRCNGKRKLTMLSEPHPLIAAILGVSLTYLMARSRRRSGPTEVFN